MDANFEKGGTETFKTRYDWPILVVISVFALPLGGAEFIKLVEIWKVRSAPIVQGNVLSREEIRKWGGIPATKLTIQVANREDRVFAVMPNHTAAQLGRVVQFRYSGDPRQAVHVWMARTTRCGWC